MTARFRSKSIASALAGGLTAVVIAGTAMPCAAQTQAQPARPTTPAQAQAPARTSAPPPVVAAPGVNVPPEFTIGADDVLSIVFWRDKELTAEVTVRPDGKISLPLLNDVQASGLTPSQLKDRIVDESKKYVEDPNVTVVVKQINSRKVYITGSVERPGPYPLLRPTTILQLIAMAGGLKEFANSGSIVVVRTDGNAEQATFQFNYNDVKNRKNLTQNIPLKPGDTVIVP